jgi:hypothetical protein
MDVTIAAHIQENWTASNTSSITPTIEPLTYIPSMDVEEDFMTNPNIIKTSITNTERMVEDEPNGDFSHYYRTEIVIDIWAETPTILNLFQDEINRIIWEIRPNENTRLKKSDGVDGVLNVGTQDCEIESFQDTELTWEYIGTDDDSNLRVTSQGILECNWFKLKT